MSEEIANLIPPLAFGQYELATTPVVGGCGGCLGHGINRKIDWYITCPGWMDIGLDQVCSVCSLTSTHTPHSVTHTHTHEDRPYPDGNWLICCIRLPIRISTNWVFAFQSGKKDCANCVCVCVSGLESGQCCFNLVKLIFKYVAKTDGVLFAWIYLD